MCRYSDYNYRSHAACFTCHFHCQPARLGEVEGANVQAYTSSERKRSSSTCPNCGGELAWLGRDFKAPAKSDHTAWKIVEMLYAEGIRFESCGCTGPGPRPHTMPQAKRVVRRIREARERALQKGTKLYPSQINEILNSI